MSRKAPFIMIFPLPGLGTAVRCAVGPLGLLVAGVLAPTGTFAAGTPTPAAAIVVAEDAWVRGTVEGQTGSGAYMHLTSSEDAQLTGASSPVAEHVEIHEMRTVDNMMHMRRIDRLALPAHVTVALDHEYHVMFIGLKHQLLPQQIVPITLDILDAAGKRHAVQIEAPVLPLTSSGPVHGAGSGKATPHG